MSATTTSPTAIQVTTVLAEAALPGLTPAEVAILTGKGRSTVTAILAALVAEGTAQRTAVVGKNSYRYTVTAPAATPEPDEAAIVADLAQQIDEAMAEVAAEAPATAPACNCGGDEVGHVAHPARTEEAAAAKKGSVDKARTAALAALGRAGADGMKVSAVWGVMQAEGGIVWVGAYRLLNRMRRENGVIVTGEHKAENRTARLAPR